VVGYINELKKQAESPFIRGGYHMLRRLLQWTTALVLVCVFSGPADAQNKVKAPHVGQPAPAFNL
jgi:hypothetical protein